jgi:serine/threonine protein kinase/Tfp pilus assembly protein PilF
MCRGLSDRSTGFCQVAVATVIFEGSRRGFTRRPIRSFTGFDAPAEHDTIPLKRCWLGDGVKMIGRTISHYKILEKIGEGGMGVVYRALDHRLDRSVALKFLLPKALNERSDHDRFVREAQHAAALDHPNICTIYEIDEQDGETFIAMAYLNGESLAKRIRNRSLSIAEAMEIARQIACGLEAAHRQGIVHRDIKSANIVIMPDGLVKILDFGLSEACNRAAKTLSGFVTGTPSSMSPEQLRGGTTDRRSDIWSWGVVFYEMLTGQLPFVDREHRSFSDAILQDQPPKPSEICSNVQSCLDDVVMKALSKDVHLRYQNATEIIDDLRRISESFDSETFALEPTKEFCRVDDRPSIAVLALTDMSEHKDQQYFCDGIAEEIINHLSKIPTLRVASRTSSFSFRDQSIDVREIGRRLAVNTVLEGSLRKAGDDLRITCQLVGISHGYHLWSQRYDRKLKDVFAIQEEIAKKVAEALKLELSDSEKSALGRAATYNIEAYDFYLRGREYFYGARQKTIRFALEMFRRATGKDPGYSRAYAGIADCHSYLYMHFGGLQDDLDRALEASEKALKLDPNLAEGHAAYGFALSLSDQLKQAEEEFEAAIRLNPNSFDAYYLYARMCFAQKRLDKSAKLYEIACDVCPAGYQAPVLLALTYKTMGESSKANAAYTRGLKRAESHLELHPDDSRAYYLAASALAELGEKTKAEEFANRAIAIDPDDAAIIYGMACLHAQLGQIEKALDLLEQAIKSGFRHKVWIENDADLLPVFGHPRFEKALAKIR